MKKTMVKQVDGKDYFRSGKLRGDKVQWEDGVGCCVWYPFAQDGDEEDAGQCWDFSFDDIDDLIALLQTLKDAPANTHNNTDAQ